MGNEDDEEVDIEDNTVEHNSLLRETQTMKKKQKLLKSVRKLSFHIQEKIHNTKHYQSNILFMILKGDHQKNL